LESAGFSVRTFSTPTNLIPDAERQAPALFLLDIMVPGGDGLEVCRKLRAHPGLSSVPIIFVTARAGENDRVLGLELGADDYITKPFGSEELMARIRVALRHSARSNQDPASSVATAGDIKVDYAKRLVFVAEREVHLTPIEYKLIVALMRHAGMVLTHKQLLDQVWGPGHAHQMQYLRVYMAQLRQKLEENPAHPKYLVTEPGVGYRLKSRETPA
jgi:DNA-binding response OmpR family regulator